MSDAVPETPGTTRLTKREEFDLDEALAEAKDELQASDPQGELHLSDDVLLDLARKALGTTTDIRLASTGLSSVLGLSRKSVEGLRVSVDESGKEPVITVDAYLLVRWGVRVPDLAWDVQELLKRELERVTGYRVKAVNIHVQGIFFETDENQTPAEPAGETSDI
ncbi:MULTISPECIES: Asp23/Gls24 family envelope stress response protein [Jonquetella]|uniref:Asp23/Gls24 family envelope stress response protein n=1 Tax=Jonquetella TaxID=428711 RepID=UPI0001B90EFA|nr:MULTISPECIES: Asp23/Gls24 family envelope stress response protein [Jonquetella]EEX49336.1 hypothetical protein GCWU000246_00068 [Jonquetella anthropi E3_33 E1]